MGRAPTSGQKFPQRFSVPAVSLSAGGGAPGDSGPSWGSQTLGSRGTVGQHALEKKQKRASLADTWSLGALSEDAGASDPRSEGPDARKNADVYGAKCIKKVFQTWDLDGSGTISRGELKEVMREICPMTEAEIDMLMREADTNGDGIIQFSEFVDWLTQPAKKCTGRAILDYANILKPLFKVYDRQGTGAITWEEFKECHAILQNALRLHPQRDRFAHDDPMDLQKDAWSAFREADVTKDGLISFTDFVSWMRDHLDTEDLHGEELASFTQKLAKVLKGIFHLDKMAKENSTGCLETSEEQLLGRLVENLAKVTREFEQAVSAMPETENSRYKWEPPPVGLSIHRLKGQHMKQFPVSMRDVDHFDFEILCVPIPDAATDTDQRLWVTEVVRIAGHTDGKRVVEPPCHYVYDRESFRWALCEGSREFEIALEHLPPEITVFCILKTEADWGIKLGWAGIQKGLKCAVDMDLITSEQLNTYTTYVEEQVTEKIKDGIRAGSLPMRGKTVRVRCEEALHQKFVVRPLQVMATLTKLGIVKMTPLWKNIEPT